MGFVEQVKGWLRSEAKEAKEAIGDLESRLDSDLSAKERQLGETPSQAMERLQHEIAEGESSLDAIGDKIGRSSALADARAELAEDGQPKVALDEHGAEQDPDELDRG